MSALDLSDLTAIHRWATRLVEAHERRLQMIPVWEAMFGQMTNMTTSLVPQIVAGPSAQIRKATLALEESLDKASHESQQAQSHIERTLEVARRRTNALEKWLEDLA